MCDAKPKPTCKFGATCYRKNVDHLLKFDHPKDSKNDDTKKDEAVEKKRKNGNVEAAESLDTPSGSSPAPAKRTKSDVSSPKLDSPKINSLSSSPPPPATKRSRSKLTVDRLIEEKFLLPMPKDFFALWDLAETLDAENPSAAFTQFSDCKLVGPYDVLAGRLTEESANTEEPNWTAHWRYPTDLPEMLTVLSVRDGHYSYWRDAADSEPIVIFVENGKAGTNEHFAKFSVVGDNVIAAVVHAIDREKHVDQMRKTTLVKKLEEVAKKGKWELQSSSDRIKRRKRATVAPALHGIGICVPVVNDVGYRDLSETNAVLKKMLTTIATTDDEKLKEAKLDSLQEMITYVQFANDEADFGMGLELGHDLFVANHEILDKAAKNLLTVAYNLLNRPQLRAILDTHMKIRRSHNLSIIKGEKVSAD